jgi:mannan endo-1,6-alpha-mannosidase
LFVKSYRLSNKAGFGLLAADWLVAPETDRKVLAAIANGCFFNMGARLARYTKNDTYLDWTKRTWDWLVDVKYIDDQSNVFDGGYIEDNCTKINKQQFSYNAGVILQGAAFMWNYVSLPSYMKTAMMNNA